MAELRANSIMRVTILVLLYDQPYCGYELIQSIRRITGSKSSTGSVYPFLHDLMKHEYLSCDTNSLTSKSKKVYTLTDAGRAFAKKSMRVIKDIFELFMNEKIH